MHTYIIPIPSTINITLNKIQNILLIKSQLGTVNFNFSKFDPKGEVLISIEQDSITLKSYSKIAITLKKLLENKFHGVQRGFLIYLQIIGVGYRVEKDQNENLLYFKLGHSHDITYKLPQGIRVFLQSGTSLCLFGLDKNQLTQVASSIRKLRPPEPYKGKGIRLLNENIKLKTDLKSSKK